MILRKEIDELNKNNSFRLKLYKSSYFTLYTIIQRYWNLFSLETYRGVQNRIVRLEALYLKGQKAFTSKMSTQEETILGL
jgi:hypothetical protein